MKYGFACKNTFPHKFLSELRQGDIRLNKDKSNRRILLIILIINLQEDLCFFIKIGLWDLFMGDMQHLFKVNEDLLPIAFGFCYWYLT